jgi:hypothetical protein
MPAQRKLSGFIYSGSLVGMSFGLLSGFRMQFPARRYRFSHTSSVGSVILQALLSPCHHFPDTRHKSHDCLGCVWNFYLQLIARWNGFLQSRVVGCINDLKFLATPPPPTTINRHIPWLSRFTCSWIAAGWKAGVWFLAGTSDISLLYSDQTIRIPIQWVPGREADHQSPSST